MPYAEGRVYYDADSHLMQTSDKDPLRRFEASLHNTTDRARQRFYSGNFADMMGMAPADVAKDSRL
jgi:hypothetical protein